MKTKVTVIVLTLCVLALISGIYCGSCNMTPKQQEVLSTELENAIADVNDLITVASMPDENGEVDMGLVGQFEDFRDSLVKIDGVYKTYLAEGGSSEELIVQIDAALATIEPMLDLVIEDDPEKARRVRLAVVVVRAVLRRVKSYSAPGESTEVSGLFGHGLSGRVAA